MCTVSYIPLKNGFILTSNRDEKPLRKALSPDHHYLHGKNIYFPEDALSGGTWIATDFEKITCCLLNGAFEKHTPCPPYRKSRGQILLEVFSYSSLDAFIEQVNLSHIEPFTLLLFEIEKKSYELRWDGQLKHVKQMNTNIPHLWQSATLYEQNIQEMRHKWFEQWIIQHKAFENKKIWDFHYTQHTGHKEIDLIMYRTGGIKTVSVSQIIFSETEKKFKYYDLLQQSVHQLTPTQYA